MYFCSVGLLGHFSLEICFRDQVCLFFFKSPFEGRGRYLDFPLHPLTSSESFNGRLLFQDYRSIFVQIKCLRKCFLVLLPVRYCLLVL